MIEQALPPATNGTEQRLDALIARMDRLCDRLAPAEAAKDEDGTVELREPEQPAPKRTTTKAKRT